MYFRKILPLFFVLLAGCSAMPAGSQGANGNQPANAPQDQAQTGTAVTLTGQQPSQPGVAAGTAPAAGQSGAQKAVIPGGAPLTMTIDSPRDQDVVASPNLEFKGKVSRDAVLSINDSTYVIPAGPFSKPVTLTEGPNAIQIVASDTSGNEIDLVLTVTYQP